MKFVRAEMEAYARRYAEIGKMPSLGEAKELIRAIIREQNVGSNAPFDGAIDSYATELIRMVSDFRTSSR